MEIVLTNNIKKIKKLVTMEGFCPIECSIGGESIVDDLYMDHHGPNSHLESVALRAYRDHFGERKNDPKFVMTGVADADATFAIASLAGLLPHQEVPVDGISTVRESKSKDLADLAKTIDVVDVNPIGLNIPSMPGGDILLTWNAMTSGEISRTTLGAYLGVGLWISLTSSHPGQITPFLEAAKVSEKNRIESAKADLDRLEIISGIPVIIGSRVFGFPEWYGRNPKYKSDDPRGWSRPIMVAWLENGKNITMGCPNKEVAEIIFGSGGLKNVFPHLKPEGWGGRESVGGSPRGSRLEREDINYLCKLLSSYLI